MERAFTCMKPYALGMIDDNCIAAVKKLARLGSFQGAAEALGTSPASFSRRIARAESFVGHPLFERARSGTHLTPAGSKFVGLLDTLGDARSIFEIGVDRLRETGVDTLRIGCGPLTTRTLIAPVLSRLLGEVPDLRVSVMVRADKEPLEALRSGTLDLAICDLTHTPDLSDLDLQILRKEPVSFWARPGHPVHAQGPISLSAVFALPLISPFLHKHWRAAIARALGDDESAWLTVKAMPLVECDDYALLVDIATRGDLICGGISDAFEQHETLGLLKRIQTTNSMTWNICAARRKGVALPAVDAFWDELIRQSGEVPIPSR
jgi:DNA-binding transcriptional LysR family regulator